MTTLRDDLRAVLAKIEMCSHVSSGQAYDQRSGAKSSEEPGGNRPSGGIDRKEDRQRDADRVLRSAEHYRRRMARAHSDKTVDAILKEAEATLEAWRKQPEAKNPSPGDPLFNYYIAKSKESHQDLARRYDLTVQRISQIKKLYGIPPERIRQHRCRQCKTTDLEPDEKWCSACAEFSDVRESGLDPFEEVAA